MSLPVVAYLGTYALMLARRFDRGLVALAAVGAVLFPPAVFDLAEAGRYINWDVLALLVGLMYIGHALDRAGFNVIPAGIVRLTGGHRYASFVLFGVLVVVVSALLDNLVAAVILTPVALRLAGRLRMPPLPFLISLIVAANLGGALTPQGSVPSMLIATTFDKTLADFLRACGLPVVLALTGYLGLARWIFAADLAGSARTGGGTPRGPARPDADGPVASKPVLGVVIIVYLVVTLVLADHLELRRGPLILGGALGLLYGTRGKLNSLRDIAWSPLLLTGALFVLVGALSYSGALVLVARWLVEAAPVQPTQIPFAALWLGAGVAAAFEEISAAAVAVPLLVEVGSFDSREDAVWALNLGANFGASASLGGVAATAAMSAAHGFSIPLRAYLRVGLPVTVYSLLIASAYVWARGWSALGG